MAVNTVQYIASWLGQHDLSDAAIAGILGNMQIESGFNTTAYNGNEQAIGLCQWEGARRTALQQFAASKGTSETDLNTQLEFLWQELQTSHRGALQSLQSAGDAQSAAAAFDTQFEGSSGSTHQQRMSAAQAFATNGWNNGYTGGSSVPVADSASSTSSSGTTGSTLNQATMTPEEKKAALIQGAGPLGQILTTIPELSTLLNTAITNGWSDAEFENAVDNSKWYRTHSDTVRNQIITQISDPATWKQNLNKEIVRVRQMEVQLGVRMNGAMQAQLATQSLMSGGWDQQTLQDQVGALWGRTMGSNLNAQSGQAAAVGQQIRQISSDYGIPVTNHNIGMWTQNILSGQNQIDGFKQQAMNQAKSMYAPFAQQIDAGQTMRQIADPYVASMSNLLELNPESINFATDPTIKKALQGMGATADGKPPTATPLWQFEQQVRSDPRWQQTANAHNETAGLLTKLGQDWGFAS